MNKVRRARNRLGLTQLQVAKRAKVNQWDISDLETGRVHRGDQIKNKVYRVLGLMKKS